MRFLEFHPIARSEFNEAISWYESQRTGLGIEFRQEIDSALERIRKSPEIYGFIKKAKRLCRIHRFPYGIIYEVRPEKIFILVIAHLHRDPDYWKTRE
jgi:mRNA-degrading endonuclease RelE of RelBE toxin-antitoxin system